MEFTPLYLKNIEINRSNACDRLRFDVKDASGLIHKVLESVVEYFGPESEKSLVYDILKGEELQEILLMDDKHLVYGLFNLREGFTLESTTACVHGMPWTEAISGKALSVYPLKNRPSFEISLVFSSPGDDYLKQTKDRIIEWADRFSE
tara:strand:+ start:28379 stop:28825 length:447 start_codon:yes stop_codon:yes gene_type:complete